MRYVSCTLHWLDVAQPPHQQSCRPLISAKILLVCLQEWKFFDTARINVKGGDGGDGCVAFRREKGIAMGGPSGGNGSRGGSVILRCDEGLNTLATVRNKVHYKGEDGSNGQGKCRHAAAPRDLFVRVPPGTVIRDQDGVLCGEVTDHGEELVVAKGGRGGRGNLAFKTDRNNAPKFMEVGEKGSMRWLTLELKLVADVGLIGVPNAGKSTLLAAVSNAKPKIADYPFTTVIPNLGVWEESAEVGGSPKGLVLADIPGLLEGAHMGVGLGLAFLRHVQRCRVLVHVVNGDSPDPLGDFEAIQQELELFNIKLAGKPQVVVLNKVDLPHVAEKQAEIEAGLLAMMPHKRLMTISAAKRLHTSELMYRVLKLVQSLPEEEELFNGEDIRTLEPDDDDEDRGFQILSDPAYPGQWRVAGTRIERTARMTNWDYYEAIVRFQRIMDAMGVNQELLSAGAKKGDLIMIDEYDFDFSGDLKASSLLQQYLQDSGLQ
ncbi:GTP1/OBG-domain-containing protein [Tribonema minus]|uniref:GTP1/OBG-domain-containing protein n=1 Tax=Tribonema minus TaxID=303371 RepID=A0A835YRC8_9STRA|nr:GTP1/OBG-domain-containing protein [Tribonema minus]